MYYTKTRGIRSGIASVCLTMLLVLVLILAGSIFEIQTQDRVLKAETQIEGFSSEEIASESSFETLSFACFESVRVVCGQSHKLTRLTVREVGFSVK